VSETTGKPNGRPPIYTPDLAIQAERLCRDLGATNVDLAKFFGVTERTIYQWQTDHLEFSHALKAKKVSNERVERALYERAIGYSAPDTKILANPQDPENPIIVDTVKHYAPETAACVVWLANRDPDNWRRDPGATEAADSVAESLSELAKRLPD